MVSVRQRSADFFVRYAIVEADRQGVTGPLRSFFILSALLHLLADDFSQISRDILQM